MLIKKLILGVAMMAGLSACATTDVPSRLAPVETATILKTQSADWNVQDVRVNVSRDLKVSEANVYYPIADIVWRGDEFGDRYAQVGEIVRRGISAGVYHMAGPRDVIIEIDVKRFHAVTEKAQISIGGIHDINFMLTVRDAATGQALTGPKLIKTNLKALSGYPALIADREGRGQKYRIMGHLQQLIRDELGNYPVDMQDLT